MDYIEAVFVSWKLRLAGERSGHKFLYLSSSHEENGGRSFLTMFNEPTFSQEATIQKYRYKYQSRQQLTW